MQPREQPCQPPAPSLQVGGRERREVVGDVGAAHGLHDVRHHLLKLPGPAVVVEAGEVAGEDGARDEVQAGGERDAADGDALPVARQPADVVHELLRLVAPEVLERVQPVRREQLGAHDLAQRAPARRVGQPDRRVPGVGAGGVRHGPPVAEDGVVPLQDLPGGGRGGGHHRGHRAQAEGHERAVRLGEPGQGAVRLVTEQVEAADDGQWVGSRR